MAETIYDTDFMQYTINPQIGLPEGSPIQWEDMDHSRCRYAICHKNFQPREYPFRDGFTYRDKWVLRYRALTREERLDYYNGVAERNHYPEGFEREWPLDAGEKHYDHAIDFTKWQYLPLDEATAAELDLRPSDGWRVYNQGMVGNVYKILYRKPRTSTRRRKLMDLLGLKQFFGV